VGVRAGNPKSEIRNPNSPAMMPLYGTGTYAASSYRPRRGHLAGAVGGAGGGLGGQPGFSAYCAAKGAVRLVTKAAALEFARDRLRIRVNSVHPGPIDTPLARRCASPPRLSQLWISV